MKAFIHYTSKQDICMPLCTECDSLLWRSGMTLC